MTTELDNDTLEWAAEWIEGSLKGEANERVREFAHNIAMTLRAAKAELRVSAPIVAPVVDDDQSTPETVFMVSEPSSIDCAVCGGSFLLPETVIVKNAAGRPERACLDCAKGKPPVLTDVFQWPEQLTIIHYDDGGFSATQAVPPDKAKFAHVYYRDAAPAATVAPQQSDFANDAASKIADYFNAPPSVIPAIEQIIKRCAAPASPAAIRDKADRIHHVGSSRHPHFTHADHERMKETLDSLSDYPTEEEAEAVLQACGTSGKEVVNEFIERLLKENLKLRTKLDATTTPLSILAKAAAEHAAIEVINALNISVADKSVHDLMRMRETVTAIIERCLAGGSES